MRKKVLCMILCYVFMLSVLCGCAGGTQNSPDTRQPEEPEETVNIDEGFIDEIKERGFLIAGCKTDVPDLSFYDEKADSWSGLEVELAYQTAANLFEVDIDEAKKQNLVQFVGVTVADREEKLEKKEVDCLFATYTITDERKEKFAFSESYYTDYIGLMVKTSGENPNSLGTDEIRSIADLDGKKIGVPKKATTRKAFLKYIDTMNSVKSTPVFFEYEDYESLFKALKEGAIDVMAVDVSILNGYVDRSTKILGDRFGGQHYGAAVRKENAALLDYVNQALEKQ